MDEISDDTRAGFQRVELLTGPVRRRRWSAEEKARIVSETLLPGARVSEVARRWQLHPQQLFGWRRDARVEEGAGYRAGAVRRLFLFRTRFSVCWQRVGDRLLQQMIIWGGRHGRYPPTEPADRRPSAAT